MELKLALNYLSFNSIIPFNRTAYGIEMDIFHSQK